MFAESQARISNDDLVELKGQQRKISTSESNSCELSTVILYCHHYIKDNTVNLAAGI